VGGQARGVRTASVRTVFASLGALFFVVVVVAVAIVDMMIPRVVYVGARH